MAGPGAPEATIAGPQGPIHLLGTIAGFVPDAARVAQAMERWKPASIALGIPAADIEGLALLASTDAPEALIGDARAPSMPITGGAPGLESIWDPVQEEAPVDDNGDAFEPLADQDRLFLEKLQTFGSVRIPSPDLDAAYRAATAAGLTLVGVDMDDEAHTRLFTETVRVRHLVQRSRAQKKAAAIDPTACRDAYDLAARWDAELTRPKPLAGIEKAREDHMATGLRAMPAPVLAIVPSTRLAGIVAAMDA